jgi:hypothetical protein
VTAKGVALWPAVYALMQWGERYGAPEGRRRTFVHISCDAEIDASGRCPVCAALPGPAELEMRPGPALAHRRDDPVSRALRQPHRLLTPVPVHSRSGPD